jgi:hypothetical protein
MRVLFPHCTSPRTFRGSLFLPALNSDRIPFSARRRAFVLRLEFGSSANTVRKEGVLRSGGQLCFNLNKEVNSLCRLEDINGFRSANRYLVSEEGCVLGVSGCRHWLLRR